MCAAYNSGNQLGYTFSGLGTNSDAVDRGNNFSGRLRLLAIFSSGTTKRFLVENSTQTELFRPHDDDDVSVVIIYTDVHCTQYRNFNSFQQKWEHVFTNLLEF